MSSFWDKKLGPQTSPPAPRPARYDANMMPRGIGQDQDRVVQDYLSRQQLLNSQQQPQQEQYAQENGEPLPEGTVDAGSAIRSWKGDKLRGAAGEGNLSCPSCGGPRYVTPTNAGRIGIGGQTVYPAPRCHDCGYSASSRTVEQGSIGIGAQSSGPPSSSRQGASLAPSWEPTKV
jgi:hypothetical protein